MTSEFEGEYVEGMLAPVLDELTFPSLDVEGEIPDGLRGTYLRNGPNPAFQRLTGYHHLDAPDPDGSAEDGGWVVTYVREAEGSASRSVVLDARNFADPPVASIRMPRRVPMRFHGNWIAAES